MATNILSVNICVVLLSLLLNEVLCKCRDDANEISFNQISGTITAPIKSREKSFYQLWSIEAIKGKRRSLQFQGNFVVGSDSDHACDFSYLQVEDGEMYHGTETGFDRFCTKRPPPKERIESARRLKVCLQLKRDDSNATFTINFNQIDREEDSITPAGVDTETTDKANTSVYIAAGVVSLVVLIVIGVVFIFCRRRRLKSREREKNRHSSHQRSVHKYDYTSVDNQVNVTEIKTNDETCAEKRDGINSKYYQEIADFSDTSDARNSQSGNVAGSHEIRRLDDNKDEKPDEHRLCDNSSPEANPENGTYDKLQDNKSKTTENVYSYDKPFERTYNTLSTNKSDIREHDDVSDVYDKMGDDGTYNILQSKGRQLQQKNEDVAGVYDQAHASDDYNKLDIGKKSGQTLVDDTYDRITDL